MSAAVVDSVGRKVNFIFSPRIFTTIIIIIMGAITIDGVEFLDDLERRITQVTDDNSEKAFFINGYL